MVVRDRDTRERKTGLDAIAESNWLSNGSPDGKRRGLELLLAEMSRRLFRAVGFLHLPTRIG